MNDCIETSVCFTGHRKVIHAKVKEKLTEVVRALAENGYTSFITGGALGFDMLAARCVYDLKTEFPHIKLIIAVPCRNQSRYWTAAEQNAYDNMLSAADEIVLLSEEYYRGCMQKRNRYIVDNSTVCVYYKYKEFGGASYTVDYAEKKGRKLIGII